MAATIGSKRATRSVTLLALGAICLLGSITLPLNAQMGQLSFGGPAPVAQCNPQAAHSRRQQCVPLTGPATVAYVAGISPIPLRTAVLEYSIAPADNGTQVGTLNLPTGDGLEDVATDSYGQIYVAAGSNSTCQILVHAPGAVSGAPSREFFAPTCPTELAVDAVGRVYAAYALDSNTVPTTVTVYSATASGAANPLRTLQLTDVEAINDMAVDGSGNIYVAAWMRPDWQPAIAVYSPDATGPVTSFRTIVVSSPSVVGVAVDSKGDVFANVALSSDNNFPDYVIEEFAPGADGAAAPTNTIDLPPLPPSVNMVRSRRVRLDSVGNIYSVVGLWSGDSLQPSYVMYGFGPADIGSATPFVETQFAGKLLFPYFAIN